VLLNNRFVLFIFKVKIATLHCVKHATAVSSAGKTRCRMIAVLEANTHYLIDSLLISFWTVIC